MGNGLLVQLNTIAFPTLIRGFFGPIVKFLYYLIEKSIDLMYELAGSRFGLENEIDGLINNFYAVIIIFMVFKLTISMLNYIINPESFTDKNAGFSKLVSRIIISVILLVSINPFFTFLFNLQTDLIGNSTGENTTGNVIDNLILSNQEMVTVEIDGESMDIYTTRMSDYCPENYKVFSTTKGGMFAISALKPFYQPSNPLEVDDLTEWENFLENGKYGYCGFDFSDSQKLKDSYTTVYYSSFKATEIINDTVKAGFKTGWYLSTGRYYTAVTGQIKDWVENVEDIIDGKDVTIAGLLSFPHAGSQFVNRYIYNAKVGKWDPSHEEDFIIEFRYFWALVFGIVILFMIITFCFDIVIRAFTLFLYQIIAPIPIISYMSPNKKDTDMLMNWGKRTFSCWAGLFIRIAILDFVVYFSQVALNALGNDEGHLIMHIFVLIGLLMFAKKLPKLLEEIIPGLKMDGALELNPFKRISRDAIGGNALLGVGAGLAGMGLSAGTNFAHRGIQTGRNVIKAEGAREKLRALRSGLGRTAGSTIAGGLRGFTNSFNRTRKDGNVFGGAWNGYQTAMFSKLIREDNLRKAGIINSDGSYAEGKGIMDNVRFAAGSVGADLARYGGVLNKGQREYLRADELDKEIKEKQAKLDNEKLQFTITKRLELEPYQQYASYAQKIKDRISNDKTVKDAQKALEDAQASGDKNAIRNARAQLEMREKAASNRLMNTDNEVKYYMNKMNEIKTNMDQKFATTGDAKYNLESVRNTDGTFNSKSIYDTNQKANVIADEYSIREKAFEDRQNEINALKQTPEYIETHDENSEAKIQNAIRTNMDVQKPGFKPSSGPIQSRVTDSSQYSNLGPQGGPGGPRPGGPGGPGPGAGTP